MKFALGVQNAGLAALHDMSVALWVKKFGVLVRVEAERLTSGERIEPTPFEVKAYKPTGEPSSHPLLGEQRVRLFGALRREAAFEIFEDIPACLLAYAEDRDAATW